MRRFFLGIAALAALALGSSPAFADPPRREHRRYHDELEHREFHRDLYHRDAHRFPMTRWQHERLHDALEHDRFHDRLEHRDYHRSYRYSPYGAYYYGPIYDGYGYYGDRFFRPGFGISTPRFSFWIGR
jgi:hypothetical protein